MLGIDTCFLVDLDVTSSPRHSGAVSLFNKWKTEYKKSGSKNQLAIYYNVFLEYQHIVTDNKRFTSPLTMEQAIERIWFWTDLDCVNVLYPDDDSFKRAQMWLSMYKLGRKRLIDTHMAACYAENGVTTLWTNNRDDFKIFEVFELPEY